MSVKLMSAIFETEFRDLQDISGNITKASTAKLVLLALADHANDEGESAYPSVEKLSKKTALSPQTIRNTFDALKHNGVILLNGISKYRTNNYSINTKSFPKLKGDDGTHLTLNPLEGITGEVSPSNGSLLTLNPLDPNHQLTVKETSHKTNEFPLEWKIAGELPILETEHEEQKLRELALRQFENAFRFPPLKWDSTREWRELREFVVETYRQDKLAFGNYVIWRAGDGKYKTLSNARIVKKPTDLIMTWGEFEESQKPEQIEYTRLL